MIHQTTSPTIFDYANTFFEGLRQIHLDFHTPDFVEVAKDFDATEFFDILEQAHVNSITVFAHCHHGNSYCPTRVGRMHPGLKRDLLGEMAAEAGNRQIQLLAYFSMNVNEVMAQRHPGWHALDATGESVNRQVLQDGDELYWTWLCPNRGPVCEEFLLPHIEETLQVYPLAGVFVDMAGYLPGSCFCPECLAAMNKLDLDPHDPRDHAAFNSRIIQRKAADIRTVLDAKRQGLRLEMGGFHGYGEAPKANGILSEFYLESLAYQTGWDYLPKSARYFRNFGMPTIGMTGRFLKNWGDFGTLASTAQLKAQLCMHLMAGLPSAIGDHMPCTGQLNPAVYDTVGTAFEFIAVRQPYCVGHAPGREAAILVPVNTGGDAATAARNSEAAKFNVTDSCAGVAKMMSELHLQYDLITDDVDLSAFHTLFVCHGSFGEAFIERAAAFTGAGGTLIVSALGMRCDAVELQDRWGRLIGVESVDVSDHPGIFYEPAPGMFAVPPIPRMPHYVHAPALDAAFSSATEGLATAYLPPCIKQRGRHYGHFHGPPITTCGHAVVRKPHGNGQVIVIRPQLFCAYYQTGYYAHRELAKALIDASVPTARRLILSNAPSFVEFSIGHKAGRDILQAMPFITEKRARCSFESIHDTIAVHGVEVSLAGQSRSVRNPLTASSLDFRNVGGRTEFAIPAFSEHLVLEVEKSAG